MFGLNEQVGRKFFANEERLLVTSVFVTLQGEGPFSGCPAVFLRLTHCNLSCSFCDTYFATGEYYTRDALRDVIRQTVKEYYGSVVPDWADRWPGKKREMVLVVTGGEPSLQLALVPFLVDMLEDFDDIQIESNGILLLHDLSDEVYLVVSPKCIEQGGVPTRYQTPHEGMLARADCLKFVMSADQKSPYSSIPYWAHEWHDRTMKQVFVSPMNVYKQAPVAAVDLLNLKSRSLAERVSFWDFHLFDMDQNRRNHEYAAEYCVKHGFRLSLQQHLYASLP